MQTIFISTENSKTNEPHRFRLSLLDKLNLKDTNKYMALANFWLISISFSYAFSLFFNWRIKILFPSINTSKSFILTFGV